MDDTHLFDFNAGLLVDYDDEKAHADLEKYGDAFRFQLIAALQLSDWADALADRDDPLESMDPREVRGWVNALREVAANLRQGAYLPGGSWYEGVLRNRETPG